MVHEGLSPLGAPPEAPAGAPRGNVDAVLFDLDGTLADTLPDLASAMNAAIAEHGFPPLPPRRYRGAVTEGSAGMIRAAIGPAAGPRRTQRIRRRFLAHYAGRIAVRTRLFPGVEAVLHEIETRGLVWGIVTNKPEDLTHRLLDTLGMGARASCVVCGDTTARAKPHPEPLLHACRSLDVDPARCLFVGDAEQDVSAGRGAAIRTLVALYGYLPDGDDARGWGANGYLACPSDLLEWLDAGGQGAPRRPPGSGPA